MCQFHLSYLHNTSDMSALYKVLVTLQRMKGCCVGILKGTQCIFLIYIMVIWHYKVSIQMCMCRRRICPGSMLPVIKCLDHTSMVEIVICLLCRIWWLMYLWWRIPITNWSTLLNDQFFYLNMHCMTSVIVQPTFHIKHVQVTV